MATESKNKKEQGQKKPAPSTNKEKVSPSFMETIKAFLDKIASEDELFAVTYAKENKNIEECCNYILQQVKQSGCNGFADDEIYGMAIHYYDEDDIKDIKPVNVNRVVVNHVVELSDSDKAKAKEEALKDFKEAERKKLEEKAKADKERAIKREEARTKALLEKRERENKMQLSLFDM